MTKTYEYGQEELGQDPTLRVMEFIHGADIERSLLDLAQIGGTRIEGIPEQPERYAVNRLALSPIDIKARRTFVGPLMEAAGMTIQEHPLGLIGTLTGEDPDLPPVVIFSHTDSVPKADMYDGVTGVMGGIKVIEALTAAGIKNKRNIHVVALTGEESSAFGFALFGSRGMWHGLTDRELDAHIPGGKTIRETLGEEATEIVKHPVVGKGGLIPTPHAVIELHVEQNNTLDKAGIDLGVVEAIAAPVRFSVEVGEKSLEPDTSEPENAVYLRLHVQGKSDHSGATPMGPNSRADGLVETAKLLWDIMKQTSETSAIDIGSIDISEQALNKIPGLVTTSLRVSGASQADLVERLAKIQEVIDPANAELADSRFDGPSYLEEVDKEAAGTFYKREEVAGRQKATLALILDVNQVATTYRAQKVVGTVGTYSLAPDGKISLGLDVRGINKKSRDEAIALMKARTQLADVTDENVAHFGEDLPGSGDPVTLDPELVRLTKELIDNYKIGSSTVMFSAAGHDAQNAAKAGHPTVMIFCQSNAGGIAHHPDAYTKPENLEQGVKALAALTVELVS